MGVEQQSSRWLPSSTLSGNASSSSWSRGPCCPRCALDLGNDLDGLEWRVFVGSEVQIGFPFCRFQDRAVHFVGRVLVMIWLVYVSVTSIHLIPFVPF